MKFDKKLLDATPQSFTKEIDACADSHEMNRVRKGKRYDKTGWDD